MNGAIFPKLEIDVMQIGEVLESAQFAHKYKIGALVVQPSLSSDAIIVRSRIGGKYKIITPIDWPKGETFGQAKMRNLSLDSLDVDGFEILLTADKSENDTRNEAKALTEFIRTHLGEPMEVRFVLGTSTRSTENIQTILRAMLGIRTPTAIRNDVLLKAQATKASLQEHNNTISIIENTIKAPIKISGNVNYKIMTSCNAAKFAVSLAQAKQILKDKTASEVSTELAIETQS
jgi:hypothetical protein